VVIRQLRYAVVTGSRGPRGAVGFFQVNIRSSMARAVLIGSLFQVACSPYVISYHHVCFQETNGLQVLQRSTASLDSEGKALLFAKVGLPTKARVDRPLYTILIDVPLNSIPVVFLKVTALNGNGLRLHGQNLKTISATSREGLEGYQYTFDVERASGLPLTFTVKDAAGKTLGVETLNYVVRSRGVAYGVEGT
jgi:hypothetical protein